MPAPPAEQRERPEHQRRPQQIEQRRAERDDAETCGVNSAMAVRRLAQSQVRAAGLAGNADRRLLDHLVAHEKAVAERGKRDGQRGRWLGAGSGEKADGSCRDYAEAAQRTARRWPSNTAGAQIAPAAVMVAQSRAAVAALAAGRRSGGTPCRRGGAVRASARRVAALRAAAPCRRERRGPGGAQRLDRWRRCRGRGRIRSCSDVRCSAARRRRLGALGGRADAGGDVFLGRRAAGGAGTGRGGLRAGGAVSAALPSRHFAMRAGDVFEALFERRDAGHQPFAVGRERAHGLGQPAAFARVERPDRLELLTA